jgi:hypothetical protein
MRSVIISCLLLGAFLSSSVSAKSVYVEDDARLSKDISDDLAIEIANYIKVSGYSCNSVSAVTPFVMSRGFTIVCNQWTYRYELEDKGGNWVVTVK